MVELYDGCPIEVKRVEVKLNLPPQSGRILVPLRAALDNFLREVAGQATASRIYLEEVAFKRGEEKFAHSVRSQLESVEREASRLVKALRGDIGGRFSRQVYEMHLNLPEPAKLPAGDEKIEHRLLTSALELTKEGVEALMRFPRAPRPRCGVSPNSVEISSAGSWLCISPERALLFTIGDVPMELWVAPLWMPLSRDEFLLERFENVRRYAKLASGLLTQSRLQWR